MSSEFPANEYADKRDKWLGYKTIVLPTVRNALIGRIEDKSILDVGCGNGHFSRKFIEWSARKVLGIDNNQQMIQKCQEDCTHPEKLSYLHVGVDEFATEESFDIATALFVFQFLSNVKVLKKAFENVFLCLKKDGILVAMVPNGTKEFNPQTEEGKKFGAAVVSPQEELRDELPLTINFYDNDGIRFGVIDVFIQRTEVIGSSTIHFYFRETYEKLLKEVGFNRIEWMNPIIDVDAKKTFGEEFFRSYLTPSKDQVLFAFK